MVVAVVVDSRVEVETTGGSVSVDVVIVVSVDKTVWLCVMIARRCSVTVTVGLTAGSCPRQRKAECKEMPVCHG